MGPSMCALWLAGNSLGALGVLLGSYWCSSYGAIKPFHSRGPFSISSFGRSCAQFTGLLRACLSICEQLAGPLERQLYQALVSKHWLASTTVSGFGNRIWDGSPGGAFSGGSFLQSCSTLCLCISPMSICTLSKKECYSAIKTNECMNFLGKWMELQNVTLSEVTQSQNNTHGLLSLRIQY